MHPLLNHASFAYMTNVGLRFTLAGWYQAAKSAKLNRQRTLVDFNTVIGFSGLFVVIHVLCPTPGGFYSDSSSSITHTLEAITDFSTSQTPYPKKTKLTCEHAHYIHMVHVQDMTISPSLVEAKHLELCNSKHIKMQSQNSQLPRHNIS